MTPSLIIHRDLQAALDREGWSRESIMEGLNTWPREERDHEDRYSCRRDGVEILWSEHPDRQERVVEDLFLDPAQPSVFLLFDIDGTLLHSSGAGRRAIEEALEKTYGTAGPIDSYSFSGKLDPIIIRELMTSAGVDGQTIERDLTACLELYANLLGAHLPRRGVKVMPGVPELLGTLSERNDVHLALCTGNVPEGARQKMEHAGLDSFFSTGAFGDDGTTRDHLPPCAFRRLQRHSLTRGFPERTIVIGDAPVDISSARAGGFHSIGVKTGYSTPDELVAEEPTLLLDSFADPAPFYSFLDTLG